MRYSLWLDGHLLGETRLEHRGPSPGQRLGALRPTPYGMEVVPGLCGFLAAAADMKRSLRERGVPNPDEDVERALELLETTPEGERFTALVRTLSQLELRESGGARAAFHTVVITDLRELADLAPSFDAEGELASGAPRFIVSATEIQTREVAMRVGAPVRMRVRLEPN